MGNKLSHSASSRYQDCPKSYELHYIKGYRSKTTSSALLFGSALDKAVETYLQTRDEAKSKDVLLEFWTKQKINDVETYIPTSTLVVYANSDFDFELLHQDQIKKLENEYNIPNLQEELDSIYKQKEVIGYDLLNKSKKTVLNNTNWYCLLNKGYLMLDKAIEVLKENVIEVLGTQVKVDLTNNEGDSVIGYADFVVRWKGYDSPLVLDLKTSTKQYEEDAVINSPQLSLYVHALSEHYENTRHAGFLVLKKGVRKNKIKLCSVCGYDGSGKQHKTCNNEIEGKRCGGAWNETIHPTVDYQLLIDKIPDRLEEIVVENFDAVNKAINAQLFPRNFGACVKPYGRCAFFDVCHKDKYDEVIKKEK